MRSKAQRGSTGFQAESSSRRPVEVEVTIAVELSLVKFLKQF